MEINGINLEDLDAHAGTTSYPPQVAGRRVQIDADFLAYQVTAESAELVGEKSFSDMQHNCTVAIDHLTALAGAEFYTLFLTPSDSNKGRRFGSATLKEYQANRKGKEKPRYLNAMRNWMEASLGAIMCRDCEADDGMAMAQYKAIREGNENLSIIASRDKDLRMVPGLQLNWEREVIEGTPADKPFGYIYMDDTKSTKTLKGYGWKFFWAQMLMGDTADNITGLPLVHPMIMNKVKPTAASEKNPDKRKPGKCGPALAFTLLNDCDNNADAARLVAALYKACPEWPVHWKTGEPVEHQEAFLSAAQLLWMRRDSVDPMDVVHWIKEST